MLFTDLLVYKKLFDLALSVNDLTLKFPKFEMFELGSQLRRSSNFKKYLPNEQYNFYLNEYQTASKKLYGLEKH